MKYNSIYPVITTKIADQLKKVSHKINNYADSIEAGARLTKSDRVILNRNSQFKDLHKGKRAFVIANGPSLKNQDLSLIKNDIKFALAGFFKHDILKEWQPDYYSVIDPEFFKDPTSFKPFFDQLNQKITESQFFITLTRGYAANLKYKLLPPDRTFYCSSYGSPKHRGLDFSNITFGFQTVASFSLGMAVYMGCNPIHLLGFDHDYLAYRGVDRHFYEGNVMGGEIKEKFENKTINEIYPYYFTMQFMQKFWENYMSIDKIAQKKGIKIYNSTDGGYLDVFERYNYNDIKF